MTPLWASRARARWRRRKLLDFPAVGESDGEERGARGDGDALGESCGPADAGSEEAAPVGCAAR